MNNVVAERIATLINETLGKDRPSPAFYRQAGDLELRAIVPRHLDATEGCVVLPRSTAPTLWAMGCAALMRELQGDAFLSDAATETEINGDRFLEMLGVVRMHECVSFGNQFILFY
jgi:hypothetical protein